ncbi:MAG: sulfotransferase [Sphingobacteriales bacterium]|nr:sulfotransferase [Sphingobacteriales bacterium]MCC7224244.1 sulfotransferase [Chitinophagales bacterium]
MKLPDFFIVGAPKCGTTALYDYLQQHPQIWLPQKELYYFGSDFTFRHPRPTEAYYHSLFADAPDRATCIGEASVWYLYAQNAAAEIKRFNPNAKIIALLRRPDDMLYSLHSQQLYAGNEDIADFAQALAAEPDRRKGSRLPPHIGCPYEALYYSQVPRYATQLQRYFDAFGRDNVLVVLFDDLASNPAAVYRQTLQFLGVPHHELPQFKQINPNKTVRSPLWRDLLKQRPAWLVRAAQILLPSRRLRQGIVSRLWAMNTRYTPRPPLPAHLRQQLIDQFADDINQLSALLQRDLSAWQYPPLLKAQNS